VSDTAPADLKAYLRRLGWSLASLPERDRDDIVEETRVHVLERIEQGRPAGEILAALGPPESYARGFIDEMEISGALASQRPGQSLALLLRRAHRSAVAAAAVLATTVLAVIALMGVAALVAKPFDPEHVGLWTSPHGAFFVGAPGPGFDGHEHLGNWIYPAAVLDLAVTWFLGRRIVLWAVRRLAR
jgi:uncharacterized membrane protein